MIPTPFRLSDDVTRVFVTTRDADGVGHVAYVDVMAEEPWRVLGVASEPVLGPGRAGMFDDNGVAACSIVVEPDGALGMYYVGFELCRRVRYRLFTGLARSRDGGKSFVRVSETPVLDRSHGESIVRGGPFCWISGGIWRMLYVAGGSWEVFGDREVPVYDIRYLESEDGILWGDQGHTILTQTRSDDFGFGRPFLITLGGLYQMVFSVRSRSTGDYLMGYAESENGADWTRRDEYLGLHPGGADWESTSVTYGALYPVDEKLYMFYNGDGFGEAGFALAVAKEG